VRQAIWFSDLGALTVLPQELAEIDGLKRLSVGDGQTPDGRSHILEKWIENWTVLLQLPELKELYLSDTGLDDISVVRNCTKLVSLDIRYFKGEELGPLSGLSALSNLNLGSTPVSDLDPLSGLSALSSLSFGNTQVSDLGPLSGLSALSSLSLDGTRVSDFGPLSGLSALSSLSFDRTQVSDLDPLSGLSALSSLSLAHTQVSDMSVLLSLPVFASLQAKFLSFGGTPLSRRDRRWQMLSGLPPKTAAIDVVLYLKGEHPDFREPFDGAQHPTGAAAIASGAPVVLQERNGRAEVLDAAQFQPPIALDSPVIAKNLNDLRALIRILVEDLGVAKNVDPLLRTRVERYADAVLSEERPVLTDLGANMLLLRGMITDEHTRSALDQGTLGGLDALVKYHDQLGAQPTIPDPLPVKPEVPTSEDEKCDVIETLEEFDTAVQEATEQGLVGPSVERASKSTLDVAKSANTVVPPANEGDAELRRGKWSWALRMVGGLSWALENYGKAYKWAQTPAGAALIKRFSEILEKLGQYFD